MMNLDEFTITGEVLRRLETTPDARLKAIMSSLVGHLHAFARETQLTEAEWLEGIRFLTRTGQTCSELRQEFILLSDTLGLSQLVVAQNHSRPQGVTEQTVFGPFHFEGAPKERSHGADIARGTPGEPLFVKARVADASGRPVPDAVIDVWQSDSEGFYDIQDEKWTLENARLRAVFDADGMGSISFRSTMPGSYPIPMDGPVGEMMRATGRHPMRPAHLHFMIRKPGFDPLVTHIFVDGDEWLDSDAVFGVRSSCIGKYVRHAPGSAPNGQVMQVPFYTLEYDFVLHPIGS